MRSPNLFEKILLGVGLLVILVGFGLISQAISQGSAEYWSLLQTILLWLMLIVLIILLAVNENVKEELKLIAAEQLEALTILSRQVKKGVKDEEAELRILKNLERHKRKL
jgi:Na+/melibiose symporter-like transporter